MQLKLKCLKLADFSTAENSFVAGAADATTDDDLPARQVSLAPTFPLPPLTHQITPPLDDLFNICWSILEFRSLRIYGRRETNSAARSAILCICRCTQFGTSAETFMYAASLQGS